MVRSHVQPANADYQGLTITYFTSQLLQQQVLQIGPVIHKKLNVPGG